MRDGNKFLNQLIIYAAQFFKRFEIIEVFTVVEQSYKAGL
jgi:hypothetical protein